jgi:hypothetical protein
MPVRLTRSGARLFQCHCTAVAAGTAPRWRAGRARARGSGSLRLSVSLAPTMPVGPGSMSQNTCQSQYARILLGDSIITRRAL